MGNLRLRIRGYRAIKDADVTLGDLTVLTGVNASGKSTIASIFHSAVEIHRNRMYYAEIQAMLKDGNYKKIRWAIGLLEDLDIRLPQFVLQWRARGISRIDSLANNLTGRVCDFIWEGINDPAKELLVVANPQCLESFNRSSGLNVTSLREVCNWFVIIRAQYEKLYSEITAGATYHGMFGYGLLTYGQMKPSDLDGGLEEFKIFDGNILMYDVFDYMIPPPSLISPKRSLYIYNPSISNPVRVNESTVKLGGDYYESQKHPIERSEDEWRRILSEALPGELEEPEEGSDIESQWAFKQRGCQGQIDFNNCAEGIKSLVGLDLLDRYGLVDSDSLIVIDEPEVHLHPQWIVSCAQMLISLVKDVKARVLIASHSPYLVQAIKTLSVGKLQASQIKFYLAEKKEGDVAYSYRDLKGDIGPIFESFNLALDKIALYED